MKANVKRLICEALEKYDRVALQNILMKVPDREIAVALTACGRREMDRILSLIGQVKGLRVREELKYQEKLFIPSDRLLRILKKFLSYFDEKGKVIRDDSYIRPRKRSIK